MAVFWQISGPKSHIRRDWRTGKANAEIAEMIFDVLSVKSENGMPTLTLILGIESSGASQILLPNRWRDYCKYLDWTSDRPYLGSQFASLSPIHIDTQLKLQVLLEERQHASGVTKASKGKGDNSKANGRFWNSPPHPSRAVFEHNRCLWRIIKNEFHPPAYGLPEAPWRKHVAIFSLALNFWVPGGYPTSQLLDASLTKLSIRGNDDDFDGIGPTWYFRVNEHIGLQNSREAENAIVQKTWHTITLSQEEIGREIQNVLNADQATKDCPTTLILLLHDYSKVKKHLPTLEGLDSHKWAMGIKSLLNFDRITRQVKQEPYAPSSRKRSCSPGGPGSSPILVTREESPGRQELRPLVYVVETLEMFKAATKSEVHLREIRPVHVFNTIAGQNENDTWSAGNDSGCILQSWKRMVQGPSVDEQRALFGCNHSTEQTKDEPSTDDEHPQLPGLYEPQKPVNYNAFGDVSDTDSVEDFFAN